jgi:hypothetical protein
MSLGLGFTLDLYVSIVEMKYSSSRSIVNSVQLWFQLLKLSCFVCVSGCLSALGIFKKKGQLMELWNRRVKKDDQQQKENGCLSALGIFKKKGQLMELWNPRVKKDDQQQKENAPFTKHCLL